MHFFGPPCMDIDAATCSRIRRCGVYRRRVVRNCGSAVPFVCAFLRRGRSVTELSGESYAEVDAQCDKLVTAVDRGITKMKQPGTSCAISDQKAALRCSHTKLTPWRLLAIPLVRFPHCFCMIPHCSSLLFVVLSKSVRVWVSHSREIISRLWKRTAIEAF